MINLLPPEGKAKVRNNYWTRVASVYFVLIGSASFITVALLLPTYFYISFQSKALDSARINDEIETFKLIEAQIEQANNISKLLASTPQLVNDSEIVNEILSFSSGLATIGNIAIRKEDRKIVSVIVSGQAYDRASLVQFRNNAEASEFFSEVNLPLSNLAKDQNISFSLTLEPSIALQPKP